MSENQPQSKCPNCGYPVEIGEHAPTCKSRLQQKTPEQLQDQYRKASLQNIKDRYPSAGLPEQPDEIFSLSTAELHERLASDQNLQKTYELYLEDLRELRHETVEHHRQNQTSEARRSIRDQTPVPLYERTLKTLQGDASIGREKLFRDDELEVAKLDTNKFNELIQRLITDRPDVVFRNTEVLKALIPKEEIRSMVRLAAQRSETDLLINAEAVEGLFDNTEFNQLMAEAIKRSPEFAWKYIFSNPTVRQRLDKELLNEVIQKIGDKTVFENANELIAEEIISEDEARATFLRYVKGEIDSSSSPEKTFSVYSSLFTTEQDRAHLQIAVEGQALSREANAFSVYDLERYAQLFGNEWRRELLVKMVEQAPLNLVGDPGMVLKYVGDEEYQKLVSYLVTDPDHVIRPYQLERLLNLPGLSEEQEEMLYRRAYDSQSRLLLSRIDKVITVLKPENTSEFTQSLLESSPDSILYRPQLLDRITDTTEEQKKLFVTSLLEEADIRRIITLYKSESQGEWLRSFLNPSALESLMVRRAEIDPSEFMRNLGILGEIIGGDEKLKSCIEHLAIRAPYQTLSQAETFAYLFDPQERDEFLSRLINRDTGAALSTISKWSMVLPPERTTQIVSGLIEANPTETIENIEKVLKHISQERWHQIIQDLTERNPVMAAYARERIISYDPTFSKEGAMALARDNRNTRFAPAVFKDALKSLEKAKSDSQKLLAFQAAVRLYDEVAVIHQSGFDDDYLAILQSSTPGVHTERSILENAYTYLIAAKLLPDKQSTEKQPATAEELSQNVNELVQKVLAVDGLSLEDCDRANAAFGSAAHLLMYLKRHADNLEILNLVREIYTAAGKGQYHEWRFQLDKPLQQLKEAGLLPKGLSSEQYQEWTKDEQMDLSAILSATSQDVASSIRSILITNAPELGSEALASNQPDQTYADIKRELQDIGSQIRQLEDSKRGLPADQYERVQQEIQELKAGRDALVAERDLLRLALVSADEIQAGYLLEGEDRRKSQKLEKFIGSVGDRLPEQRMMFSQITQALAELGQGDQAAQRLVAQDSSDPSVAFHIGVEPLGSCQDYAHGSMNEALVGYMSEPNTKIATVSNERGNIIGRRVVRLLEERDGSAALFVEAKYASTVSGVIDRLMLEHIMHKAERMGVKAYINTVENTGEDAATQTVAPEGFKFSHSMATLSSENSRAPFLYVDAVRGAKSHGKFKIRDTLEITRSTEIAT